MGQGAHTSTLSLDSHPGSHSHQLPVRVRDALQLEVHRVEVRKLPFEQFIAGEGLVRVIGRLGGRGGAGKGGEGRREGDEGSSAGWEGGLGARER